LLNVDLINKTNLKSVVKTALPFKTLDFTQSGLGDIDLSNTGAFDRYVFSELLENNTYAGIGGYLEHRTIYKNRGHFGSAAEARNIHLGVDIWLPAGQEVYAIADGHIHSYKNNANFGDYGPTLLLAHLVAGQLFHTLYGHLSLKSMGMWAENTPIKAGDLIGWIGPYPENGDWPPHLHFQVIENLEAHQGDYPGVCHIRDLAFYKSNCPDPSIIMGI
jgi:peptidoglycan LD-endopeptidase LytH